MFQVMSLWYAGNVGVNLGSNTPHMPHEKYLNLSQIMYEIIFSLMFLLIFSAQLLAQKSGLLLLMNL